MPVFVRAGTVLPTGPVKQYTYEPTTEPVKLTIYPGANGQFAFYDDDGLTFAYEHGNFSIVEFDWNDESKVLSLTHREPLHAQTKEFVVEVVGEVPQRISLRSMPKKVKF
jgi:alpha-glucosidase (family GH31 glycosyl hydrolase)